MSLPAADGSPEPLIAIMAENRCVTLERARALHAEGKAWHEEFEREHPAGSRDDLWRFMGEKHGYRPCCIEAFISQRRDLAERMAQAKELFPALADGHVPCAECITRRREHVAVAARPHASV